MGVTNHLLTGMILQVAHHAQHPQKSSSQHLPVVIPPEGSPKMGGKGRPTTGFPTSERSRFHHPKKVTTRWWQLKHLGENFTPKFFGDSWSTNWLTDSYLFRWVETQPPARQRLASSSRQDVEVAFADAVRSGHARQVGCRFGRGSGGLKSRRSG